MGRYDIALDKKKKVKKKKSKSDEIVEVAQKKRKGKLPVINNDSGEVISPGLGRPYTRQELSARAQNIIQQQLAGRQITERYERAEIDRDLEAVANSVSDNGSEIIQTGPRSRNFTITGPNGYRVSIPIRRLNIRSQENFNQNDLYNSYNDTEIVFTLSANIARALLSDIEEGQRRYGHEPL